VDFGRSDPAPTQATTTSTNTSSSSSEFDDTGDPDYRESSGSELSDHYTEGESFDSAVTELPEPPQVVRRSTRQRQPPDRFKPGTAKFISAVKEL
jgi:hypothetical protein